MVVVVVEVGVEGEVGRWVLRRWWKVAEGMRGEPAVLLEAASLTDADVTAAGLRRGASKGFLSIADAFGVVWDDEDDQSFNMIDSG